MELRQLYQVKDEFMIAYLHLGFLAYWLVITIRCQLKASGITYNWTEIVRIGNTQIEITTSEYNKA